MIRPVPTSWQVTLADLSLILFLVTLAGFAARAETEPEARERMTRPSLAPSQALYRPEDSGLALSEWLAEQPFDPRATLTILVHHPRGDAAWALDEVAILRDESSASPFPVRVIIEEDAERLVYASLAYDSPRHDGATALALDTGN